MSAASKLTSLREAARLVEPGETLALGGFTLYRRPVALVRALLELRPRNLTLLSYTGSYESDLLIGAGCAAAIRTCYTGFESFGLAPCFTSEVSAGRVKVIEESEASLSFGLRASLAGIGFMPGPGWIGTDMLSVRPDVKTIQCPYTGRELVAYPAVTIDTAVIHVPLADRSGNARLLGNLSVDRELSMVARKVIITAEQIVDELDGPLDIPEFTVTAVVHAPRGAWPTSCHPLYGFDGLEILRYLEMSTAGDFEEYVASLGPVDGKL